MKADKNRKKEKSKAQGGSCMQDTPQADRYAPPRDRNGWLDEQQHVNGTQCLSDLSGEEMSGRLAASGKQKDCDAKVRAVGDRPGDTETE